MGFKAQLEVLVHMESFRNINVYHQGIYVLRAQIYQKIDETVIHAHPYRIVEFDASQIREKMRQKYKLSSDLYDHYFFSKAFVIKYMDEMVDLDDICHFRAEIDAHPSYNEDNFYFSVDLLFADLAAATSENTSLNDPDKGGFKVVASFESLLHNSFKGIREYVPVYFTDLYYSQVNMTVHTALINYQFRYSAPRPGIQSKGSSNQPQPNQLQRQNSLNVNGAAKNPENFEQFFDIITGNYRASLVDEKYNNYVGSLRNDHKLFRKHFVDLAEKMNASNSQRLANLLSNYTEPKVPEYIAQSLQANQEQQEQLQTQQTSQKLLELQSPIALQSQSSNEEKGQSLSVDEESKSLDDDNLTVGTEADINSIPTLTNAAVIDKRAYYSSYYDSSKYKISGIVDLSSQDSRKKLVSEIQKEINELAGCQFMLWNSYIELLRQNTVKFTKILLDEYTIKINDQWGQSIFRFPVVVDNFWNLSEQRAGKTHIKQAKTYRKKSCFKDREPLNVEDLNLFPKAKVHPIIFHEIYVKSEQVNVNFDVPATQPLKRDEVHLIVLVHGFQGSSYDLRLFSNNITIKHSDAVFLHSSINEDNTDGDIGSMGIRLADEVKKFITQQLYGRKLKRLSFVGHSLGGLIIRSALPFLSFYEENFFTLMTFSSPHMGFMFSQSKMVDAGLWFMKAWNKSECLKQMTMVDAKNPRESFIYQLAFKPGLSKFKQIILLSSPQDSYVPFHSARMQQTNKQAGDTKNSIIYDEMLKEIFRKIELDRIHRVDVSFEIPGKVLDNLIGRAAHIQFLENESLMKMLLSDFRSIFI